MTTMNNYFDAVSSLRPYTHSSQTNPGSLAPKNALRGEAPKPGIGFWPCERDGAWVEIEDHRERSSGEYPEELAQAGTEYWLQGDTRDTPARKMTETGPLPDGALLAAPDAGYAFDSAVTLEDAQSMALDAIRNRRDQAMENGTVVYKGNAHRTHKKSRESMAALLAMDAARVFENWKLDGQTWIMMTAEDLKAVFSLVLDFEQECRAVERVKVEAVMQAGTSLDIAHWLNTSLDSGWAV